MDIMKPQFCRFIDLTCSAGNVWLVCGRRSRYWDWCSAYCGFVTYCKNVGEKKHILEHMKWFSLKIKLSNRSALRFVGLFLVTFMRCLFPELRFGYHINLSAESHFKQAHKRHINALPELHFPSGWRPIYKEEVDKKLHQFLIRFGGCAIVAKANIMHCQSESTLPRWLDQNRSGGKKDGLTL